MTKKDGITIIKNGVELKRLPATIKISEITSIAIAKTGGKYSHFHIWIDEKETK